MEHSPAPPTDADESTSDRSPADEPSARRPVADPRAGSTAGTDRDLPALLESAFARFRPAVEGDGGPDAPSGRGSNGIDAATTPCHPADEATDADVRRAIEAVE